MIKEPTQEIKNYIKNHYRYEPETGFLFFNKINSKKFGKRAGSFTKRKDRHVYVFGRFIKEHHIAWYFMTGRMAKKYH